jgi:hypothetical protein
MKRLLLLPACLLLTGCPHPTTPNPLTKPVTVPGPAVAGPAGPASPPTTPAAKETTLYAPDLSPDARPVLPIRREHTDMDSAMDAVKNRVPQGSHISIREYLLGAAKMGGSLNTFKEIGWSATQDGPDWRVTYVFIGGTGLERHSQWKVHLKPLKITPLDSFSKQIEQYTVLTSQQRNRG